MGPEETTNLGGSQERWIPDPNDHARFCISATSQTVLYMIFFKLKLVLIDAIHHFFFAAKRHQICPQEQKRTPKELRASRSGKIHAQRPGRAKTVAREREPLPSNGFTGRCASHGCYERAEKPDAPTHCENETERAPKGSHGGKRGPEGGPRVYNATATPQPPRSAGGAPEA